MKTPFSAAHPSRFAPYDRRNAELPATPALRPRTAPSQAAPATRGVPAAPTQGPSLASAPTRPTAAQSHCRSTLPATQEPFFVGETSFAASLAALGPYPEYVLRGRTGLCTPPEHRSPSPMTLADSSPTLTLQSDPSPLSSPRLAAFRSRLAASPSRPPAPAAPPASPIRLPPFALSSWHPEAFTPPAMPADWPQAGTVASAAGVQQLLAGLTHLRVNGSPEVSPERQA